MIVYGVHDRRNDYGQRRAMEVEPLDYGALTEAHLGRTVIYRDHGIVEAGTITSWRNGFVFVRFTSGSTSAACDPRDLMLATAVA